MRGEHFLLLAEREKLLAPVVLAQLRQILAQQRRPATGEAVARLLVDRGFLTVEQARHLVEAGSGGGSPLVPKVAARTPPVAEAATRSPAAHHSDDLTFAPDDDLADRPAVAGVTTEVVAPSAQSAPTVPVASSPVIPTPEQLTELIDSLRQWMEMPGTLDWRAPPSPIFAERQWQVTPGMVFLFVGGFFAMFVLLLAIVIMRLSTG